MFYRNWIFYFHIIYSSPPLSSFATTSTHQINAFPSIVQRQYFRWGAYRLIMYASNVIAKDSSTPPLPPSWLLVFRLNLLPILNWLAWLAAWLTGCLADCLASSNMHKHLFKGKRFISPTVRCRHPVVPLRAPRLLPFRAGAPGLESKTEGGGGAGGWHSSRAAAAAGSKGLRYRECNSLSIWYSDLVFGIHTSAPIQICEFQVQNLNMQLHSFFKECRGGGGGCWFLFSCICLFASVGNSLIAHSCCFLAWHSTWKMLKVKWVL